MTLTLPATAPASSITMLRPVKVRRHGLLVRITHWLNVVCLAVLLMSGLQILNAHPRFYWGAFGADDDQAIAEISAVREDGALKGITRIGPLSVPTTGLLGVSERNGQPTVRAFPGWATLPAHTDLATGRRWHFFFAWLYVINGLAYLLYGLVSGHFRRDVVPDRDQLSPAHIAHEIKEHARLRFPKGDEARRYNTLQKLAYLAVIFGLLPAMVLTGLCMSPGFNSVAPWLADLFGGRQSARTIHFICAALLVAFVVAHVAMVVASGLWNNLNSMVTGRYTILTDKAES